MDYNGINFPIGNIVVIIVVWKEPENFCLYWHLALCVLRVQNWKPAIYEITFIVETLLVRNLSTE